MLFSSPCVYGCAGRWKMSSAVPSSTTRPMYITLTRSQKPATTARSWVISSTARSIDSRSDCSSSMICAWIVTSRAVVGSSAMTSAGRHARAMAIITRCSWPPDRLCGYRRATRAGSGMPTSASISRASACAWSRDLSWCSQMTSATWWPTVKTGDKELIGSWKTMAMSSPRIDCIRSPPCSRAARSVAVPSAEYSEIDPDRRAGGSRSRRSTLRAVTLLPEPLSPTRPTASPRWMVRSTPLSTSTSPSRVSKVTFRSSICRTLSVRPLIPCTDRRRRGRRRRGS